MGEKKERKRKTYALHERKEVLTTAPSGLVEVVPVAVGGASVHHEVDGAATAENVGAAVEGERSARKGRRKENRRRTGRGTCDREGTTTAWCPRRRWPCCSRECVACSVEARENEEGGKWGKVSFIPTKKEGRVNAP
jgi:hypothetical protein